MALSWTQDRLGPICRYAEDCALVMQAIARPDGRDMSVTDLPFNWNADLDIRRLRVGIIQDSFDEITNPAAKANAQKTLETLKAIGVRELIPVTVPDVPSNVSAIGVESAVFFDEHARAGRMKGTRSARPTGRLVPAVEWLQSQRVRMMMMMELARATAHVDVYIVGSNNTGVGGPGGRGAGAGGPAGAPGAPGANAGATPPRPAEPPRPQSPSQRHFGMANLACYPAINLPNGFAETGTPTNATLYAQPYRELEILALAKAYQDAAKHHLVKPKLDG
jgi:Asp-tRNA(Asn)/Glu-tRNA(Gln) amidotransferase A subunit family amidase